MLRPSCALVLLSLNSGCAPKPALNLEPRDLTSIEVTQVNTSIQSIIAVCDDLLPLDEPSYWLTVNAEPNKNVFAGVQINKNQFTEGGHFDDEAETDRIVIYENAFYKDSIVDCSYGENFTYEMHTNASAFNWLLSRQHPDYISEVNGDFVLCSVRGINLSMTMAHEWNHAFEPHIDGLVENLYCLDATTEEEEGACAKKAGELMAIDPVYTYASDVAKVLSENFEEAEGGERKDELSEEAEAWYTTCFEEYDQTWYSDARTELASELNDNLADCKEDPDCEEKAYYEYDEDKAELTVQLTEFQNSASLTCLEETGEVLLGGVNQYFSTWN
ncbi:MAG: hypothetical protein ACI9QC_000887 [Oceanicoccus sp.]|jgi:hypothetical protein